jgi:hypothetical protein
MQWLRRAGDHDDGSAGFMPPNYIDRHEHTLATTHTSNAVDMAIPLPPAPLLLLPTGPPGVALADAPIALRVIARA